MPDTKQTTKEFRVALDIFMSQSYHIEASSESAAIEKAKELAWGEYPDAELTVYETEEE